MNNFRDERDIEDDYDMMPMPFQNMNFNKNDLEFEKDRTKKHPMGCPFFEMMQSQMLSVLMNNMRSFMMPQFERNNVNCGNNTNRIENNNQQNTNQNVNKNNSEDARIKKFQNKADEILQELEQNNPEVYKKMKNYGIPYEEARNLSIAIVNIVLRYCLRRLDELSEIKENDNSNLNSNK